MDWQPIETVPKDGTHVDLWIGNRRVANCFFDRVEFENEDDWHWRCEYSESPGCSWHIDDEPTHWMPLPPPPSR